MSEIIEARLTALTTGGESIGPVVHGAHAGKKTFIEGGIPGELVKARIVEDRGNYLISETIEVIESSPHRCAPKCQFVSACGGCQLQHIELGAQRIFKREMVESFLKSQAKIDLSVPANMLGDSLPGYGYRNRVGLHLSKHGELGFYREGSGTVVAIDECSIASTKINVCITELLSCTAIFSATIGGTTIEERADDSLHLLLKLREGIAVESVTQLIKSDTVPSAASIAIQDFYGRVHPGRGDIEKVHDIGQFSQVNSGANVLLVNAVTRYLKNQSEITELYAGSGNFTIPLAKNGAKITAVELSTELVKRGRAIILDASLSHLVKFVQQSCEKFAAKGKFSSAVLLDPPRAGAKAVIPAIVSSPAKKVVYVSCSLPTLGRDLKILQNGGFALESVDVLDMFPQTHHVETISVLCR